MTDPYPGTAEPSRTEASPFGPERGRPAQAFDDPAITLPAPQVGFQQPSAVAYPEPDGPANLIDAGYSPYAASAFAGQRLPANAGPVTYGDRDGLGQIDSAHPLAVTSMVFGILGLAAFLPLAPVAWYLAAKARGEMSAEPYRWRPSGMITAGLVMGIIGTVLLGLLAVLVVLGFLLVVAAAR